MVTTAPNGTTGGCGGFPTLNDKDKLVQYPDGDTVSYADYHGLVQVFNPGVSFPKTGWVHVVGDKLAIKLSNNNVYTEQQMNQLLEKERERLTKYRATPQGKQAAKQYRESDRGRQSHRESQHRYAASDKGKTAIATYNEKYIRDRQSHREHQHRYAASDKGKTAIANYNEKNSRVPLPKPFCPPICFDDVADVVATAVPIHDTSFNNNSDENNTNDTTEKGKMIGQMLKDSNECLTEATSSNFKTLVRNHRESLQDMAENQNKSMQEIVENHTSTFQNMIGSHKELAQNTLQNMVECHTSQLQNIIGGHKELAQNILGHQNTSSQDMLGSHKKSLQSTTDSTRDGIIGNLKEAIGTVAATTAAPSSGPGLQLGRSSPSAAVRQYEYDPQVERSNLGTPPPTAQHNIDTSMKSIVKSSADSDDDNIKMPHGLQVERSIPCNSLPTAPHPVDKSTEMIINGSDYDSTTIKTSHNLQVERSSTPSANPTLSHPVEKSMESHFDSNESKTKTNKQSVSFDPVVGEDTDKVKVTWLHVEMKLREAKTIDEVGKIILHTMSNSDHEHLREDLVAFLCSWKLRSQQKSVDLQKAKHDLQKLAQENERLRSQVSSLKAGLPMDKHEMMGKIQFLVGKNQSLEGDVLRLRRELRCERDDSQAMIISLQGKNAALSNEARKYHREHRRENLPFSPIKEGRGWSPIIDKNKAANERNQQSEHGRQQQQHQQLFRKDDTKENRLPSHRQKENRHLSQHRQPQRQQERQWPRQVLGQEDEEYPDDEVPASSRVSLDHQTHQGQGQHRTQQVQAEYRDDNSSGLRRSRHSIEEEDGMPPSKKLKKN